MTDNFSQIQLFETQDGLIRLDVHLQEDTVWLIQSQMVVLFGRDQSVIARHIRNIFMEGELEHKSVHAKIAYTAEDGKTYQVDHYNLDVIISVGYRVKSARGVLFRKWATQTLKQHLVQGYTLNRQRFEENALALERALELVRKIAQSPEFNTDAGRSGRDCQPLYANFPLAATLRRGLAERTCRAKRRSIAYDRRG